MTLRLSHVFVVGVLAVSALPLITCSSGDSPSSSTDPQPATTPAPTTQSAAATATPPRPFGQACNAPPVTSASGSCAREEGGSGGVFISDVDAAIELLRGQEPDIFEGDYVLSIGRYRLGVIKNLEAKGLCAAWDNAGHGELQVKDNNGFSEQYHIQFSNGNLRKGAGAYRATCRPAIFPVPTPPLLQRGDCALPSSRDIGCGRERSKLIGAVEAASDQIIRERPDLVRQNYIVGNVDDYYAAMNTILKGKGYCAIFDGHDIAVKLDNSYNEQFHVVYSWGELRRGESSYRATCYPAAF